MNKYNILPLLALMISAGCADKNTLEEIPCEPIHLSAGMETSVSMDTKASDDPVFPNESKIGIIAANCNGAEGAANWADLYIDNQEASTTGLSEGVYPFTFTKEPYWPFDPAKKIAFLAYSPVAGAAGTAVSFAGGSKTTLQLVLGDQMPDVLYADRNAANPASYSKSDKKVDLGQFKHALSQVSVIVKKDGADPSVKIKKVELVTPKLTTFDLLTSTLAVPGTDQLFTYTLFSGSADQMEKTVLVYPDTEGEISAVNLTLEEKVVGESTKSYEVSLFKTAESNAVRFERAKKAVLTITIKGKDVTEGDGSVKLTGSLTDWVDMGKYGVTIQ